MAEPLVEFDSASPTATRSAAGRRCAASTSSSARASSSSSPGRSGSRQVDPAARLLRPRAPLPRRRGRGRRSRSAGSTSASTARPSSAAWSGSSARSPRRRSSRRPCAASSSCRSSCAASPPAARARAIEEVALALAIAHLLDRPTDTLSGGELQRVALAAALVLRPRLVLLDEPTSQLDPVAGDELIGLLRRLNEEWGMGVLLAEHRLERCLAAADRVVALDAGAIAFDGAPARLLRVGARRRPDAGAARARGCSRSPGSRRCRSSVKEARAALRARGIEPPRGRRGRAERPPRRRGRGAGERARRPRPLGRARRRRPAPRDVLRGLELAVEPGERVALMGRNGAGKSTLLRAAAGLVEPARGSVEAPARLRAAAAEPRRPARPRAGRRRAARRARARGARRRSGSSGRPTPTRATSPAASASGSRWRS